MLRRTSCRRSSKLAGDSSKLTIAVLPVKLLVFRVDVSCLALEAVRW